MLSAAVLLALLLSAAADGSGPTSFAVVSSHRANPFSPKASLARYWSMKIPNGQPKPSFLLSLASPLSPSDAALYLRLASLSPSSLSSRLSAFCSAAALFCPSSPSPSLSLSSSFSSYSSKSFSNYARSSSSSFSSYSPSENVPTHSFRSYSRNTAARSDVFSSYSDSGNVVTENFTSYGGGAAAGSSNFTSYASSSNVPALLFSNYASSSAGRPLSFSSYSSSANSGEQSFSSYSKHSAASSSSFSSYANSSNVISSSFRNYGESSTSSNASFAAYGFDGNVPTNSFSSYAGAGAGKDRFSLYREQANVGDDKFSSYKKAVTFSIYGRSFNEGSDKFSSYGKSPAGFAGYSGENTTFKAYADRSSASFRAYNVSGSGRRTMKWAEVGRFFREKELKEGSVVRLPDLNDRLPGRAFLPRALAKALPFSTARLPDLLLAFNASRGSALARAMEGTLAECERPPSRGETKRCATSAEDVIDFAASVLGRDIVVRATAGPAGSGRPVRLRAVRAVDQGRETKAVSCHQSLFPYRVYYCHFVPRVRAYVAEFYAGTGKINDGVAICHLDTSDWSPRHGAFVALGEGPGKIEVCHWIYPGDMTWTTAV